MYLCHPDRPRCYNGGAEGLGSELSRTDFIPQVPGMRFLARNDKFFKKMQNICNIKVMDRKNLISKFFQKEHLLKMTNSRYKSMVFSFFDWLLESDNAQNDKTNQLFDERQIKTGIRANQDIIIAGMEEVESYLSKFPGIVFKKFANDGDKIKARNQIAYISGSSRIILSFERTIVNIFQRMSGIAKETVKESKLIAPVQIAATRKTPWMLMDKKAVAVGGGLTHRLNLSDGILIKNNHLKVLKKAYDLPDEKAAVNLALENTLSVFHDEFIEIEVNTEDGANDAFNLFSNNDGGNNGIIMFDNWEPRMVKDIVENLMKKDKKAEVLFEASGNINESNLEEWAKTGVDVISSGALTHSCKASDLSLEII